MIYCKNAIVMFYYRPLWDCICIQFVRSFIGYNFEYQCHIIRRINFNLIQHILVTTRNLNITTFDTYFDKNHIKGQWVRPHFDITQ